MSLSEARRTSVRTIMRQPPAMAERAPLPRTAPAAPVSPPAKPVVRISADARRKAAAAVSAATVAQARLMSAASPIIPPQSVAGRALLAIIAIMSFLAAVTLGTVVMVRGTATEWQAQVARELTIQVRPAAGRDIEADVARSLRIAREVPGVAGVRAYTREESAALLEPWLGTGFSLKELPVPRLIVVTAASGAIPDVAQLRGRLAADVSTASVDDHRAFLERMQSVTGLAVTIGFAILGTMLAATVLLVGFATRGAMAANRAIIEVLHFVGAKNRYIAGQFQRHFLRVGCTGAGIGGAAALLPFIALWLVQRSADTSDPGAAALFGTLALGPTGYAGIILVLALIAAVTVLTSRWTVHRTLNALD